MDPSHPREEGSKKRTRGITCMSHLNLMRNNNMKLNVEVNDRNAPLGENGKKLSSYIGVVARTSVPIDIMDWRAVSKELKNKIWKDISVSKFRIV